jgi:hypothetical protein
MKAVWARAIEDELATLLEYALSDAPAAPSENLLATASVEESMSDLAKVLGPADLRPSTPARVPRHPFPTPATGPRPLPAPSFPSVPPDDLFAQPSQWEEAPTDADPHAKSSPFGPLPGRGTRR